MLQRDGEGAREGVTEDYLSLGGSQQFAPWSEYTTHERLRI